VSTAQPVDNVEATDAWNGPLFERFVRFKHVITGSLGAHGDDALALSPPQPGERALDVGCGFGDTAIEIGRRVGGEGSVLGVDVAERFIDAAREDAAACGADNVRFRICDVETEPIEGPFDYAFSRFGTMFFANPVPAMRNVRSALRPGGRLCSVVWRQKEENDWVFRAEEVTKQFLDDPEQTSEPKCGPGPFSMANADTVTGVLLAAGFEGVSLRRNDLVTPAGRDLDEALEFVMALGPAGELIRINEERGERERPRIAAALREAFADWQQPDGSIAAPSSTWIITATVPGA
jgi:SAM-dependent methyltransferase